MDKEEKYMIQLKATNNMLIKHKMNRVNGIRELQRQRILLEVLEHDLLIAYRRNKWR